MVLRQWIPFLKTAFRYSLSVLKIYSICDVHCRFSVLTVNIETQLKASSTMSSSSMDEAVRVRN